MQEYALILVQLWLHGKSHGIARAMYNTNSE